MKKQYRFIAIALALALAFAMITLVACNEEPHEHVYDKQVADPLYLVTEATCEYKATYYYSCECGEFDANGQTFEGGELVAHKLSKVEAVAPDCENDGSVQHWHCSVCGKDFASQAATEALNDLIDPATGHTYNQKVVDEKYLATEATCEHKATYYYSCKCGEFDDNGETFEGGQLAEHTLSEVGAVAPDCDNSGILAHWHCDVCGKNFTSNDASQQMASVTDPATGHTYDQKVVEAQYLAAEATCEYKATYYYSCHCGAFDNKGETFEVGELAAHTLSEVGAVAPDCDNNGILAHWNCSVCGKNFTSNDALQEMDSVTDPKLGHDITHGVYSYDSDLHWIKCTRCDLTTPKDPHTGGVATTTERAVCDVCGQEYGKYAIPDITGERINAKSNGVEIQLQGKRDSFNAEYGESPFNEAQSLLSEIYFGFGLVGGGEPIRFSLSADPTCNDSTWTIKYIVDLDVGTYVMYFGTEKSTIDYGIGLWSNNVESNGKRYTFKYEEGILVLEVIAIRTIELEGTEPVNAGFIRLLVSQDDLAYIRDNATSIKVNGEAVTGWVEKGFVIDTGIQVKIPDGEMVYVFDWYDQDGRIATCKYIVPIEGDPIPAITATRMGQKNNDIELQFYVSTELFASSEEAADYLKTFYVGFGLVDGSEQLTFALTKTNIEKNGEVRLYFNVVLDIGTYVIYFGSEDTTIDYTIPSDKLWSNGVVTKDNSKCYTLKYNDGVLVLDVTEVKEEPDPDTGDVVTIEATAKEYNDMYIHLYMSESHYKALSDATTVKINDSFTGGLAGKGFNMVGPQSDGSYMVDVQLVGSGSIDGTEYVIDFYNGSDKIATYTYTKTSTTEPEPTEPTSSPTVIIAKLTANTGKGNMELRIEGKPAGFNAEYGEDPYDEAKNYLSTIYFAFGLVGGERFDFTNTKPTVRATKNGWNSTYKVETLGVGTYIIYFGSQNATIPYAGLTSIDPPAELNGKRYAYVNVDGNLGLEVSLVEEQTYSNTETIALLTEPVNYGLVMLLVSEDDLAYND